MSKYKELENYLTNSKKEVELLKFNNIEKIINTKLPRSAYEHREWWSNSDKKTQSKSWLNAGWKVRSVELGKYVTFIKERITKTKQKKDKDSLKSLTPIELGNFYLLISTFEHDLRTYILDKFERGFIKIIKKSHPKIYDDWQNRKKKDQKWGITTEPQLINYALLTDYMEIIKHNKRMFSDNIEDLNEIISHFKTLAIQGRNPLMHCRTLNLQKYYTTKSAVEYLRQWMKRKK